MSEIVHLRVYEGDENYTKNGKIKSKNHVVKLEVKTKQFRTFLGNVGAFGITRIEIVGYFIDGEEAEIPALLRKKIETALKAKEKPKSAEEVKIDELNSQLARQAQEMEEIKKLLANVNSASDKSSELPESPEIKTGDSETTDWRTDLELAREKYKKVFDKAAGNRSLATIVEQIENA